MNDVIARALAGHIGANAHSAREAAAEAEWFREYANRVGLGFAKKSVALRVAELREKDCESHLEECLAASLALASLASSKRV